MVTRPTWLLAFVVGCCVLVPGMASAQEAPVSEHPEVVDQNEVPEPPPVEPPPVTGPAPLSVTISGGGTKGAYMAGQLYYLQHLLRLGNDESQIRVFTGASAGAINSITSVLAQCGAGAKDPRDSLFWSVWIPVGLNELFAPNSTETSLFSRTGFDPAIGALEKLWDAGLPVSCDLLIGIAITRLTPRSVKLAPAFPSLPRSLETVLLRVTGRGRGRQPLLRNYVDPAATVPQVILPLDGKDAKPFESLRNLVFASSAFPVGFEPVDVAHCMSEPGKPARCTPRDATSAQFIDGGVFDNQPLGLSVRAMRGVIRNADGTLAIADEPQPAFLPESRFVYVDPRVSKLPGGTVEKADQRAEGAIDVVSKMLGMAESVQSAELLNVFEREASIRDRLVMTQRHHPHVSSTFSGLLDRKFREFDFYLGLYDAARAARERGHTTPFPEDAYRSAHGGWRAFRCLRALYDAVGEPRTLCAGDDLEDFRILAQVTLDRLHDLCLNAMRHEACRSAPWKKKVLGVRDVPDAKLLREEGESDIDFLLRLLAQYRFHFRDLGLDREDAEDVRFVLTRKAQDMVVHLASVQPSNSLPLSVLGRMGVDVGLGYVPPQHIFHFGVGLGSELGYSLGIDNPSWTWLRFTTALELDGFSSLLNADDNYIALRPKLGFEVEPVGTSFVQLRLGIRGGYQFSTGDRFTRGDCDFDREDEVPCSRVVTEGYVATTMLGLVRLQVAGVYLPPMYEKQTGRFAIRPMVGVQLNSPF